MGFMAGQERRADVCWVAGICCYFLFQTVLRRLFGASLGLDEAQIILEGQSLAWGYGPQPPLYSWMQWAVFQVIGDPILAMALLKNGLLVVMCLSLYRLIRSVHPPQIAGLATLGLLLLPQFAWESQRALTHSVLVSAMAALACLVLWTWVRVGARGGWVLMGLVVGAGMLAKFNFIFVAPALLLAAYGVPDLRRALSWRGVGLVVGIVLVLQAGPVAWMLGHPQHVMSSSYKLGRVSGDVAWWAVALEGGGAVLVAAVSFVALALLIVGVFVWGYRVPIVERAARPAGADELRRFLVLFAGVGLLVIVLVVLASGSTSVKDRWLQPVLFVVGPVLVLWLLERVGAQGKQVLGRVYGGLALLVMLALPVNNLYGQPGKPARRSAPVGAIAGSLEAAGFGAAPVVTDREWLAGNLFYQRPAWQVRPMQFAGLDPAECLDLDLVWMDDGPEAGQSLANSLSRRCGADVTLGEVVSFSAPHPWQPNVPFVVHAAHLKIEAE